MEPDWSTARRRTWLTDALRAFCVAMWLVVLVALGAAVSQISQAHADVLCEQLGQQSCPTPGMQIQLAGLDCVHRGEAHAAQQHTTREADSRWHVVHGQLPTCDLDNKDDSNSDSGNDDTDLPGHRDHAGVHCYRLHCG